MLIFKNLVLNPIAMIVAGIVVLGICFSAQKGENDKAELRHAALKQPQPPLIEIQNLTRSKLTPGLGEVHLRAQIAPELATRLRLRRKPQGGTRKRTRRRATVIPLFATDQSQIEGAEVKAVLFYTESNPDIFTASVVKDGAGPLGPIVTISGRHFGQSGFSDKISQMITDIGAKQAPDFIAISAFEGTRNEALSRPATKLIYYFGPAAAIFFLIGAFGLYRRKEK